MPVPQFGAGASPTLFANPPGSTPGNPALPTAAPVQPPIVAQDDGEDDAPAAPAGNAPISIGDYQMPRIGSGFPAQSAPVAPVPAATPVAAPSNPVQSFLQRAAAGLHSVAQGGSLYGAITGNPDDATSKQAQISNVTARALIAKGVAPPIAVAAVQPGNTELLKSLIDQNFGPKTLTPLGEGYVADKNGNIRRAYEPDKEKHSVVKIGQDAMGREQYGTLNQATGEIAPIKAPNAGTGDVGTGLPGDLTKHGPEYISSLPPLYQGTVQGLVEGTAQIPRITTKNQQQWQMLFDMAKQADPSFDSAKYPARVAGMKDFSGGGKSAEMVRAANQTIGHVGDLIEKADALHNRSFVPWNYATNKISSAMGDDAAGNWVTNAHAVADEIGKLFKGNNLSDTEIKQWAENLTPNMSPQQQRGSIKNLMSLLQHSLDALEDKRTASIGQMASDKMGPLLTSKSKEILDRVMKWANGEAAAAPEASAAPTPLTVGQSTKVGEVTIKKVRD
ncbi:hypothetical protein AOQ73_05910 [Bradyrhizobium pachyrhizi]|nr:hypothetical protein AOQ73_05910 [Bradyrhizobium pachyrhizi]